MLGLQRSRLFSMGAGALATLASSTVTAQQTSDEIRIEADATSGESQPIATGPDDSRAREGELVIVVHELPPQRPTVEPPPRPRRDPNAPSALTVLPTDAPDTPARQERAYAPGLVFGANAGVGAPSGVLGAFVEAAPLRALALRLGAGIGVNFGPSIEIGAVLRPLRWGRFAPVASLTYSTNFTPSSWRSLLGLSAAANSHWITPAIGLELRLHPIILLRISVGAAVMANTGEFTNYANGRWWGPSRPPSFIGYSPLSAADAHDEGRALVTPAIWFDFGVLGPQW
jgi:hypothetical protein